MTGERDTSCGFYGSEVRELVLVKGLHPRKSSSSLTPSSLRHQEYRTIHLMSLVVSSYSRLSAAQTSDADCLSLNKDIFNSCEKKASSNFFRYIHFKVLSARIEGIHYCCKPIILKVLPHNAGICCRSVDFDNRFAYALLESGK